MRRWLYLLSLVALQLALVYQLTPPLARALSFDASPGLASRGWPALLQLLATAAAVVGASLALMFPALALWRHRHSGPLRFYGTPGWAVALALSGSAILAAASLLAALAPALPSDSAMTLAQVAQPALAGGLALASAGVLCAEILHRAVIPSRVDARGSEFDRPRRIEGAHAPELRTRTV